MDILDLDKEYWDNRYKNRETGWDIGYASPALIEYAETVIPKEASILIPGCGNAYEAKALLDKGFKNITLLDIAPTLVNQVKKSLAKLHRSGLSAKIFLNMAKNTIIFSSRLFSVH
ncbi:TPMT family class I SAM-dependent methyltransferase [Sphingobacterium sp. E70]|uniref:TPMT family class I SAM-dependent methyltransferase n=1 Tax=Sphingobacterium sp. E70 TaxID=2853439 RepID=UPI00211CD9F1|nr:TPMT family class I SAM-dependent methyltransferase [Sphingobacterium sp. E70]